MFTSLNPATGVVFAQYKHINNDILNKFLKHSYKVFNDWSNESFAFRAGCFNRAAEVLEQKKEEYARTISMEMGKPITQALAEIEKCAWVCRYYAENAEELLRPVTYQTDFKLSQSIFQPIGIVYAVMPWNFPFWQLFRCAVPAMMAGNTVVLKHSQNVPQCALKIEEVFKKSGFPDGSFYNLFISHDQSDLVIANEGVQGISLTGSEKAGGIVASQAGKNIKKTVLELGGSDPFIILEDADLEQAAIAGVKSRFQNTGQSCIAAKRFIVVEEKANDFIELFRQKTEEMRVGDPLDAETEIGPMAREDLLKTLDEQVKKSVKIGAKVLTGGKQVDREGFYYEPTIITDVPLSSPASKEETFGPVAAIFTVKTEDEAIRLANFTRFGLGASLWTKDEEKARELSRKIRSGNVYINAMVKSDPRVPFGGILSSGYGRELSEAGIKEFTNMKTICLA